MMELHLFFVLVGVEKCLIMQRKLSMQRVADIIGITVEALGKFERGRSNLKLENIMALCDLYQITVPVFETYYSRSEEMQAMMDILLPNGSL